MSRIEESVQIAAPPSAVFDFCHNFERRSEWDERVDRIELQGRSNVLRKGALVRVDSSAGGSMAYSWEGEYTLFSKPRGSTVRIMEIARVANQKRGGSEEWQFEPDSGGTRFTIVWTYEPDGLVARVLDPLWRRGNNRQAVLRSLKKAKELIEAS